MTLTRRRHRPATAGAAGVLLSLAVLAGCAQEEPTNDEVSSPAPSVDDTETTMDDAVVTTAADDAVVTSSAPDDAAVTSAAPDDEASSTREPMVVTAADDSFEIEVPGRWEDAIDLVDDGSILVAAKDTERIDEFFTNVVVTQEDFVPNLATAVEQTAEELAGEDGEYELLEPVRVDGERARGYTLVREVGGATVHQTQRWVTHDKTLYVVTFSAVESQVEEAAPVLEDILDSWRWKD